MPVFHTITLELGARPRSLLAPLTLLLLCWRPALLGSETLKMETYYPAPHAGYLRLVVSDQTLLARDASATSKVAIGIRNTDPDTLPEPLTVMNGGITAVDDSLGAAATVRNRLVSFSGGNAYAGTTTNHPLYLMAGGNGRMALTSTDAEVLTGNTLDIQPASSITGLCEERVYVNFVNPCVNPHRLILVYPTAPVTGGRMLTSAPPYSGGSTWQYVLLGRERSGIALCCKLNP